MAGGHPKPPQMITKQQYRKLMSEYQKESKIVVSAMKADVHPQTARKYIRAGQPPEQLQQKHHRRTRPDPLAVIWPCAEAMLFEAPELEAKALFEHLRIGRAHEIGRRCRIAQRPSQRAAEATSVAARLSRFRGGGGLRPVSGRGPG